MFDRVFGKALVAAMAALVLLFSPAGAEAARKKSGTKKAPAAEAAESGEKASGKTEPAGTGSSPPPPAQPTPQQEERIKKLIALIESKPQGLIINNRGQVEVPPDHQPYSRDGSRNQNFVVTPDLSQGQAALVTNHDQLRAQAVTELINMGPVAVPQLCLALVNEGLEHRRLYAQMLGQIGDRRAVPALIKYMEDGKMMQKTASSFETLDPATSAKLAQEGRTICADSCASLARITGEDFGPVISQWQAWWEVNKAGVGPTPKLQTYTANPVKPPPVLEPIPSSQDHP